LENFRIGSGWLHDFGDHVKFWLAFATFCSAAVLLAAAASDPKVTYIPHDRVRKGGTLVSAPDLSVLISHRAGPGEVEVHDKETDTFYVLDGAATLITGGTMVGGRITAPNQHRGKSITGGDAHQLTKGDVIVIPAGVPHWFKDVPRSIDYYVVKVLKP
jgi:mannose-6-phosphate isomerase-like protein (cupin superfamily)